MKICLISGARPQFIKLAPLLKAFKNNNVETYHIHSGQHYDKNMSDNIFQDLNMPAPDANLGVGSLPQGEQTGKMLMLIERELIKVHPDFVLVVGDTNSTLAGAFAAVKLSIPLIHLEAGLRSFDWHMPEEINRITVDRISSFLITSTPEGVHNLIKEGIQEERIYLTGDIMVDSLYQSIDKITENQNNDDYFLVTLHRQENVDIKENCIKVIEIFKQSPLKLIFPMHPRTKKRFEEFQLTEELHELEKQNKLQLLPPAGYLEFLNLQKHAKGIITDSGGLQKEAFILKIPCITMRTTTEWIETLDLGANRLLGLNVSEVIDSLNDIVSGKFTVSKDHPYGDGDTAEAIVSEILKRNLNQITFQDNIQR